nr:hypothetical protein BHE74_00022651 [Ipomoea batatas]
MKGLTVNLLNILALRLSLNPLHLTVLKLRVKYGVRGSGPHPRHPPIGVDQPSQLGLHENGGRIILPRPAEEGVDAGEVSERRNGAVLDGNAGVVVRVEFSLGGDGVLLAGHGFSGVDPAVLEDDGGVSEDEVDGADDGAVFVELAV